MCWFHGLLICWLPAGLSVANPTKKALLIGEAALQQTEQPQGNLSCSYSVLLLLSQKTKIKPPRVHHVSPLPR